MKSSTAVSTKFTCSMTVEWFAQFQYLAGSCTLTLQSPLLDPPGILSGVCGCRSGTGLCLLHFWVLAIPELTAKGDSGPRIIGRRHAVICVHIRAHVNIRAVNFDLGNHHGYYGRRRVRRSGG